MTLPPQWSPKEVIDLTGDDDDDIERQVQPPPPSRPPPTVANGIANRFVNGVPTGGLPFHGNAHTQPYVQPRPAPASLAVNSPSYAPSPPAKRQKLSEPPNGTAYEEQLITISVGQHLSSYARGAVEALNNKDLDKDKLRSEVSKPPQNTRRTPPSLKDISNKLIANRSKAFLPNTSVPRSDRTGAFPILRSAMSKPARGRWLRNSLFCR